MAEGIANAATKPVIGPLAESDLPAADRILRLAFGTFLGVPDPATFWNDRDYVRGRWRSPNVAALGATLDGRLVGSNFATRWGSVGFFGPLTVLPDLWERGIARRLLDATMGQFDRWDTRHAGLFTFADSAKHVALYQKYGFYPRFLTAIMAAPVRAADARLPWRRFGALDDGERAAALDASRTLTDALFPGLDLCDEIRNVTDQELGDTVLIDDGSRLTGFAVCHWGPRSEGGAGACYIKFAAVADRPSAERDYARLLDACEALAAASGMTTLLAGANMARHEAYRLLAARGFRSAFQGVAMHRDNNPGYSRPGVYIIDDWR
jgi:GNAT superfamily N-acetyltransferase